MDDDTSQIHEDQSPRTTSDSMSLNSLNSLDNPKPCSSSAIDNVASSVPCETEMLKQMFRLPVADVCRTERCKNLMNSLHDFSSNKLGAQLLPDISYIDDDKCVEFFRNYIIFIIDCRHRLLENIYHRQYLNFIRFSNSLWNFTDKSESICVRMVAFDVHIYLIRLLGKLRISPKILRLKPIQSLLSSIMGILHNINDKLPYTRSQFREENVINYLMPFAILETTKNLICLKTAALFLLAVLVDEKENSYLYANDDHIVYILDILKKTLISPMHYSDYYGYHTLEVLQRLRHIASPDLNKKSLIKNGVLSSVEFILKPGSDNYSDDEIVAVLELLWSLSFSCECLQALDVEAWILKSRIQVLIHSENTNIVLAARGILWNIENQRTNNINTLIRKDAETPNAHGHIMISYNHRNQEIMIKIKDSLISSGYTVWMDVDHMRGSFVDAMAEGIQHASVLLLGMCQAFKDSPHCRQEVKYAYTLNIPFVPVMLEKGFNPDGWLGLMCATLIYTEFFDPPKYNTNMLQLQVQLGLLGKTCHKPLPVEFRDITNGQTNDIISNIDQAGQEIGSSHYTNGNYNTISSDQSDSQRSLPTIESRRESDVSSRKDSNSSLLLCNGNDTSDITITTPRPRILDWSVTKCQSWFADNEISLDQYGPPLTDLNGSLLFELAIMRVQAPQSYFVALSDELKLDFIDKLRLSRALRRLYEMF